MLLHPPVQRDVVVLGPAAQRVQQQDGPTVATLQEALVGVLHQEGVAVVDRVTQLEGEDGVWRGGGVKGQGLFVVVFLQAVSLRTSCTLRELDLNQPPPGR